MNVGVLLAGCCVFACSQEVGSAEFSCVCVDAAGF